MTFYFKLQFQLFRRSLLSQAISPRLIILVFAIGFVPASNYFFEIFEHANIVYTATPLLGLFKLSGSDRNNFLKSVYPQKGYRIIRLLENIFLSLPFIAILIYKGEFTFGLILLFMAFSLSIFQFNTNASLSVPTPFSKRPFEFLIGFRKTYLVLPFAYALAVIGYSVGNNNLGIAALIFVFALCVFFYNVPERPIYVWINNNSAQIFLRHKIETGLLHSTFLTSPILLFLCISSPNNIDIFLLFQVIGYAFIVAVIIAKYASLPNQISVPHGILIGICIWFPPLILIVITFLYRKAIINLKPILDD